jgi:hypothetical protein
LPAKSKLHKSPIAFLTSTVALEALFSRFLASQVPDDLLRSLEIKRDELVVGGTPTEMIGIIVSLPLVITILSVIALSLAAFLRIAPFIRKATLARRNLYMFLLPLDPRTYSRIRWSRFLWGLFYFEILWLVSVPLIVLSCAVIIFSFQLYWGSILGSKSWIKRYLIFASPLPLVLVLEKMLIAPYASCLRLAMASPTKVAVKMDNFNSYISQNKENLAATTAAEDDEPWQCPSCNHQNPGSISRCSECGFSFI